MWLLLILIFLYLILRKPEADFKQSFTASSFSTDFKENIFANDVPDLEEYSMSPVVFKAAAPTYIPKIRIFVLAYDAASFRRAQEFKYWWAVPLLLPKEATEKNPIFENIVYKNFESILLPHVSDLTAPDFIGTISHKAFQKINVPKLDEFLSQFIQQDRPFNFVHFAVNNKKLSNVHPHFLQIWRDCIEPHVGAAKDHNESLYNYWMARRDQFEEYCAFLKTVVDPENIYSLVRHELSDTDAEYTTGLLKGDELQALVGQRHYPHTPFVLERLANAYFKSRKPQKSIMLVYDL